ncbi:MAG: Na+/H+ antiporter NhaA [Gammaproteobacteria bacterium]|nr:Na+/H+ antiporter NhaA [Gammaproteobacteria bacterium]
MKSEFRQMIQHDAAGGVILVFAALLALIFANSPLDTFYNGMLNMPVMIKVGAFEIAKPLLLWINDGLMAIFFFMVGLEVKREVLQGHLNSVEQITLPAIAAIAGIAAPALVYVFFNQGDPVAMKGWAIPSATDIAFALGIFSLFGRSLPITLKLFLLSVAIFDDIGAIVIIALFYSADLSTTSLLVAAIGLAALFVVNRMKVSAQGAYILIGVVVWAAVLKSGVHATLAGFAVAWFIPINVKNDDGNPMLAHMEHALHNWVAFLILPVFAFANAGVQLLGTPMDQMFSPVAVGIIAGLFIGKQVGIFGACWLAVKAGIAKLPAGTNWLQLYGVTLLCGVGFTMSLFIGSLAFETEGAEHLNSVKIGVLVGSLLSAIVGSIVISKAKKKVVPSAES